MRDSTVRSGKNRAAENGRAPSEIYALAAHGMEKRTLPRYSCSALAKLDAGHDLLKEYTELFSPKGNGHIPASAFGSYFSSDGNYDRRALDNRILALCFMSAIAADEERSAAKLLRRGRPTKARAKS